MDDVVRQYIEEIERIRQRGAEALSSSDLADIARQVGLTDADLEAVDREIEAHVIRAKNYAANDLWDEALHEVESVAALGPSRGDLVELRSRIHAGRWRAAGTEEDRVRALELARHHLEIEPSHQPSYDLIKHLSARRTNVPYIAGAAIAVGLAFAIAMSATGSVAVAAVIAAATLVLAVVGSRRASGPIRETLPAPTALAGLLPSVVPESKVIAKHPQAHAADLQIPVVVDAPGEWDGVSLLVRQCAVNTYDESTYVHLVLEIRNHRDDQIDALDLRLVVEDDEGVLFEVERDLLFASTEPPATRSRPTVLDTLLAHDAAVHPSRLRLVLRALGRAAASSLDSPSALEVNWEAPKPQRFDLEFRSRGTTPGGSSSFRYFWWEVENCGANPVRDLYCDVRLIDPRGKEVDTRGDMVTYNERPLFAGETRLRTVLFEVTDPECHITVAVTKLA